MGFIGVYSDDALGFYGAGGAAWGIIMNTVNGNIGIGTVTPAQKLSVSGNICATGTIGACSDIRYKTNIQPLPNSLAAVMGLHPLTYKWKSEFKDMGFAAGRQLGLSAQEVETSFPEIVQTDNKGYKAIDYSRMSVVLLGAVQEQQEEIKQLQKDIQELKKLLQYKSN